MTAPKPKVIATLFPLNRTAGDWSLAGHLVESGRHFGTVSGTVRGLHFEPAQQLKRGRKPDAGVRIAVHVAYKVAQCLEVTEFARRVRVAKMVLLGNPNAPDDQERTIRRKLLDPAMDLLLKTVGAQSGGVIYVFAEDGEGHCGFMFERDMPRDLSSFPACISGRRAWFWKEGMRSATYGRVTVK